MGSDELRFVDLTIENTINKKSFETKALIDTGASNSCIPEEIIKRLEFIPTGYASVHSVSETYVLNTYLANFIIDGQRFENFHVIGTKNTPALIGWDIIEKGTLLSSISGKLLGQVSHFLTNIPSLKNSLILIIGQDTNEIIRLRMIQQYLFKKGYYGIIVKDQPDINIQSVEEKVNMLASLCRFVICENSFPSGHIDELKICALNRFVTAIIQEKDKGATWMQADYKFDYTFINTFCYKDLKDIPFTIDKAIIWAEQKLSERKEFYDKIYTWRNI